MRKSLRVVLGAAIAVSLVMPVTARADSTYESSENVKRLGGVSFIGGTELASDGKLLFAGQLDGETTRGGDKEIGGVHVIDTSKGKPKEIGFLDCPGNDNDVEVVRKGLLVVGFHNNVCAPAAGNGLMTVDVRNPRKPKVLGAVMTGKNHTLKPVPGTTLVYTAGGGLSGGGGAGPAIVDVKNPAKPEVVAKPGIQTLTSDCHDISFRFTKDRKLGFCAGAIGTGEVHIWDMSDPLKPTALGRIYNPVIQYSHYAVANADGTLLAIDDEAFAAHECISGQSPTGRVWIYDISNPQVPVLQSSFAAQRGGNGSTNIGTYPNPGNSLGWVDSWCLSHGLDWSPKGNNLGVTWFTGGWSVLNLDNPLIPAEVAWGQAENSATYSVLWHGGGLYTNDMHRGVDAFKVSDLPK